MSKSKNKFQLLAQPTFKKSALLISIALLIGALIGWIIKPNTSSTSPHTEHIDSEEKPGQVYTCSMHPQITASEPGDCPICGMELIPLQNDLSTDDPLSISMSPNAMKLANVSTWVVEQRNLEKEILLNGKVQIDERRVSVQSSHIPGRIEKLLVNFTGEYVKKGQVIAHVYSPDLVTAQQELFEAQKLEGGQSLFFKAAINKLKNWKLSDNQIEKTLELGVPQENFPVRAETSGFVGERMVSEGDYITKGAGIFKINDLSKVWVLFDVYESDLSWITTGSEIKYSFSAFAGEEFRGTVSYIDPVIDVKSRVAKARVEVINIDQRLKPEMFASGTLTAPLPMDSAVVSIPKTAVMWTGKRSVVYVKNKDQSGFHFNIREVSLGASLGKDYVIESGLYLGEEIAVNGTFSIDAAAQLAGKPSMMNPSGGAMPTSGHHHNEVNSSADTDQHMRNRMKVESTSNTNAPLALVYAKYFNLKKALIQDDLPTAKTAGRELKMAIAGIELLHKFDGNMEAIVDFQVGQSKNLEHIEHYNSIEELRMAFIKVSQSLISLTKLATPSDTKMYILHCPMVDGNKGADWLSLEKSIENPYFGASMLTCGKVIGQIN